MNKLLLLFLTFVLSTSTYSQINETEPNEPLLSGNNLPENTVLTGQTCMWNEPDFFQVVMPQDGVLRIHTGVSGEGINPSTALQFQLFTAANDPWYSYVPLAGENGAMMDDVFEWCCLEAGTYYIQVYSGYAFSYCYNYTLSWELVDAAFTNDNEPNSTFATAEFLNYDESTEGHLSFYPHPQGSGQDGTDFYAFVPPMNGTVRLFIDSQAESTGSNNISVNIHTINGSAWYAQSSPVASFPSTNSDTLIWECIGNDTMYFSLNTTNYYDRGYAYRIRYDVIPMVFGNDSEPNNFFAEAQLVNAFEPIEGNQYLGASYYWGGTQEDIFKFYKPVDGFLKVVIHTETHTGDGTGGNTVQLYDHTANYVGAPFTAPIGLYGVPAVDTMHFETLNADTFYLKTYSAYAYPACRSYRIELLFDEVNGVKETSLSQLRIYPNPNNGDFQLDTRQLAGMAQLQVIDFTGRIILNEQQTLGGTIPIRLSDVASGYYLLKIVNDGREIHQPFMVSR
ncbi:MAG: T9SS type A sorting domain-containing protein [Flavobacteriales bacterium]|jgi:hypothetical protein|nr:T9SS type A sorting domain-containing protein [Flavobacteriales bacterium]